jgi:hypothetical protein
MLSKMPEIGVFTQSGAGADALQLTLRFSFRARLTAGVRQKGFDVPQKLHSKRVGEQSAFGRRGIRDRDLECTRRERAEWFRSSRDLRSLLLVSKKGARFAGDGAG